MKAKYHSGKAQRPQTPKQAKLFRQLAEFSGELDRTADARDIRMNRHRPAPAELLPMVF